MPFVDLSICMNSKIGQTLALKRKPIAILLTDTNSEGASLFRKAEWDTLLLFPMQPPKAKYLLTSF